MNFIKKFKIFFSFLSKDKKKNFYFVVFLLVCQSLLEAIGIGMIIPIISITVDLNNNEYLKFINQITNNFFFDQVYLILFLLFLILLFFIFKTFFLFYCSKKMYQFCFETQVYLKNKVFDQYLKMPYSDFLKSKSAKIITDIQTNVPLITQHFLIPFLSIASDGLILLVILTLLLLFETQGFIFLSIILIFTIIVSYKLVSKILKKVGYEKEYLENKIVKIIQNSIGSMKITKLYNLEDVYFKNFSNNNTLISNIQAKGYIFQNLPRIILELSAFVIICFLIIFLIIKNTPEIQILNIIGVFAAAGFKLIPSVNRIMISLQGIKYSESVIKSAQAIFLNLEKLNLEKDNSSQNSDIKFEETLEFKNILFKYPDKQNYVLNNFNLLLKKNSKIGIIGKSGVGKSTFLDILVGLLKPSSGEILVDGSIASLSDPNWTRNISYVPQFNYIIDDTIAKNIAFGVPENEIDYKYVDELLNLTLLKNEIEFDNDNLSLLPLGERGINLSGGQIQRIGIARALYRKPNILVLDEPTSSLDAKNEAKIINILNNIKNLTLVIVSHKTFSLSVCDEIYAFENGECLKKDVDIS